MKKTIVQPCIYDHGGRTCAFSGRREVSRTVVVKGRWVEGRREVRGSRGNRYVYRPRRWVPHKKPRKVVRTYFVDVTCDAPRLGKSFGAFSHLCAKHAKALAQARVSDARGDRSRAVHALLTAKRRVAEHTRIQQHLEAKLSGRTKSSGKTKTRRPS